VEHEGKRSLGRPRRIRDNNVKLYLKDTGPKHVDCIFLAHC
jgi:hypothetical protein